MSSNTKQVLAITLGSLGLVIGIFAMVTAYNAKQAADDDSAISAQVNEQFAAAQTRQDAREDAQASKAEQLIDGLSKGEKGLVKKINSNAKMTRQNKKTNKNQNKKIKNLQKKTNTLTNRDKELESEVASLENTVQGNFNTLTRRVNHLNGEINDLQQSIKNLRNRVSIDEDFSN
jgi:predicted RNase H-like nuclease (RuvC/YqgF family)